jgi:hypothetical protein
MCAACSGLYKACAAAPIMLGFEDVNEGGVANPFSYGGLDFTAISPGANPQIGESTLLTIINANNEEIPEVESGVHALEAMYARRIFVNTNSLTQSLSIADSNGGGGGVFVAVYAYLNGQAFSGFGATISLSGMLGATPQPNCSSPSFPLNAPGTTSGPDRVFFADIATDCTVDALTLDTTNTAVGSGGLQSVLVSLDDFVVCKANSASGVLQGVLPP